jgi:hypothetical protein
MKKGRLLGSPPACADFGAWGASGVNASAAPVAAGNRGTCPTGSLTATVVDLAYWCRSQRFEDDPAVRLAATPGGRYGPNFNAIMFRRTTVSAEDAIERSKEIYGPLGGKFNEAKLRWRMPNGGRMAFAYLESVSDADEYQGRNITDAWVEEAGQYPASAPIDRLSGPFP